MIQVAWDPTTPHDFVHSNADGTVTMWVHSGDQVGFAPHRPRTRRTGACRCFARVSLTRPVPGQAATIVAASATRCSWFHGGPSAARGPWRTSSALAPRMARARLSTSLASK